MPDLPPPTLQSWPFSLPFSRSVVSFLINGLLHALDVTGTLAKQDQDLQSRTDALPPAAPLDLPRGLSSSLDCG